MTNDATRATAGALPEINRRRFLLNTTMAAATVAVTAPVAAAEPEMTPREQAIWHLRELERLTRIDGAKKLHVAVIATYGPGDCRGLAIQDSGNLIDPDNMFAPKGGAA